MDDVDPLTRALLARYAFDAPTFERLRTQLREHAPNSNSVRGRMDPPRPEDLFELPSSESAEHAQLTARGMAELAQGRVAVVILAGGMATRFGGLVKAAVEVFDGHSFLALKLDDVAARAREVARPIDVALMTSFATDSALKRLIAAHEQEDLHLSTFAQSISLRLTEDGGLFRGTDGKLSPYAPGHGDLPSALRRAGVLSALRARGVRHLFMSNVDNLAATLDPAVIGAHAASGHTLSFEVVALEPGDKGGVPVRLDGRLQVVEAVRYPPDFDQRTIPWFSINNFVLDLESLDREFALDWFRVDKAVGGRTAVQFERFVNQLTALLPSRALVVGRDRFLPIKDPSDLQRLLPTLRARFELRTRGADQR
jgi:UTP--glucose-1-phosphate uridylyltransferase